MSGDRLISGQGKRKSWRKRKWLRELFRLEWGDSTQNKIGVNKRGGGKAFWKSLLGNHEGLWKYWGYEVDVYLKRIFSGAPHGTECIPS